MNTQLKLMSISGEQTVNIVNVNHESDFGTLSLELIRMIGKATRELAKRVLGAISRFVKYLDQKWTEGGEIYNRERRMSAERYAHQGFYFRSFL